MAALTLLWSALATAAGLLVAELWPGNPWSLPQGVLALAGLVLSFLVAPAVEDRFRPVVRVTCLSLSLGTALVTVVELPANLGANAAAAVAAPASATAGPDSANATAGPGSARASASAGSGTVSASAGSGGAPAQRGARQSTPTPQWALQLALAAVVGPLAGKRLLLHRYASIWRTRIYVPEEDDLLESQRRCLDDLMAAIKARGNHDEGQLVQLVGRWGDAKSFLLQRLPTIDPMKGTDGAKTATVRVDVWKHQNEPDLHAAIVEQVLAHRAIWHPFGWLRLPLSLVIGRAARQVRLTLALGRGANARAQLDMPLQLPRLTGQRALETAVSRARLRGWRTVLVLDELDRAAPKVAQAAVTLCRRSLDLPGVVVVLAYVDELLKFKVFNPLVETLPDIGSTMRAVMWADGPARGDPRSPGGLVNGPTGSSLADWEAWREVSAARAARKDEARPASDADEGPPDHDGRQLADTLRLGFAYASPVERHRLQSLFASKYLNTRPVVVPRLNDDEVGEILVRFATLRGLVSRLVGGDVTSEPLRTAVPSAVKMAIDRWKAQGRKTYDTPPVRALEGELYRRLAFVTRSGESSEKVSPSFVAAVALAAYDAAGALYADPA